MSEPLSERPVLHVIVGSIQPAGGRLQVQFGVFNVSTEQQVMSGSVGGTHGYAGPARLREHATGADRPPPGKPLAGAPAGGRRSTP